MATGGCPGQSQRTPRPGLGEWATGMSPPVCSLRQSGFFLACSHTAAGLPCWPHLPALGFCTEAQGPSSGFPLNMDYRKESGKIVTRVNGSVLGYVTLGVSQSETNHTDILSKQDPWPSHSCQSPLKAWHRSIQALPDGGTGVHVPSSLIFNSSPSSWGFG